MTLQPLAGTRPTSRLLASRPNAEAEVDDHPTRMKSLMLAGNEFQNLGRAIVKEDEYEEVRWDGIVSTVSWRERVFRLWWEERAGNTHLMLKLWTAGTVGLCAAMSRPPTLLYGVTQVEYGRRFPNRRVPDSKAFTRVFTKLRATGAVASSHISSERVNEQNVEEVEDIILVVSITFIILHKLDFVCSKSQSFMDNVVNSRLRNTSSELARRIDFLGLR
ncbi:hypothetical protein ANN_18528 [Periplaneta americana]|uniref:Uncharacterized protein n=1 Tax=Periplaneta americana TaxID=6978 RepID=A0ABQ8SPH4_PERAM|nr:hypothetical protein ANN_18528 [Periplaneta americana]